MNILTLTAGCCLFLIVFASLEIFIGLRRMEHVKDIPLLKDRVVPKVSIIIPACNEETTIGPALRSMHSLDYQNYEVIVVNDRSTDGTEEVLKSIKKEHPSQKNHHISHLPKGWLGKSHALHYGASQASGEYLLFTDADITLEKTTLSRAIHRMLSGKLDHLSIFFENITSSGLLNALFLDMGSGLMLMYKPWKVKDLKSKRFMGVGAFNLVRKAAYLEMGGHSQLAMHPIDDVMLGKMIKQHGYRQDCLQGHGYVSVKWYRTAKDFVNGLMKNTFAFYRYNIALVLVGVAFIFLFGVLPFWAIFFTTGKAQLMFGLAVLFRLAAFFKGFVDTGITPLYTIWAPVTPYVSAYISLKAMIITLKNDGITWRGTHYPLGELKDNLL